MIDPKPHATVLDATAANRHLWDEKFYEMVLYMDIEPALQIPPDLLGDNTQTGFPDKRFKIEFYDPPHSWGATSGIYTLKNHEESKAYWKKYDRPAYVRKTPGYYGLDKYKTKQDLLNHVGRAQKELHRILEDGGLLIFKWCEVEVPLREVLKLTPEKPLFGHKVGKLMRTHWIAFLKPNAEHHARREAT